MAHLHIHSIDNARSSIQRVDPENQNLHWHIFPNGDRTSTDAFGEGHTHTLNGQTTSPPIIVDN